MSLPHRPSPQQPGRRQFLAASGSALLATASGLATSGLVLPGNSAATAFFAERQKLSLPVDSETLVQQLFSSLSEAQRKTICFDFENPLRRQIDANWHITPARINKDFSGEQQDLIKQIFRQLHSEEYADKVLAQVEHDSVDVGGFGNCSVALFGQPGSGKFEFVLTGRHVTRRCDGDSSSGTAFGGPIFYGHAAESFDETAAHPGNAYWFQAQRAGELFQALDGRQRKLALLDHSRGESGSETVKLAGRDQLRGLPFSELSADQKRLAQGVLNDLLAPFREADRRESLALIDKQGWEQLHISWYAQENIGDDELYDVWQIEGPALIWYFRGKPHVHTWVHVKDQA
ncbi:MAG: DUF3500 domain-containing protein [Planctomycetota bacterium]